MWKKLGYKTGTDVVVVGPPAGYMDLLKLPPEMRIQWIAKPRKGVAMVHVFCREAEVLRKKLKELRKLIASDGVVWVSWPKKTITVPTDITENVVRSHALPLGFVDIKVCAVDDVWSGLKLVIRKSER